MPFNQVWERHTELVNEAHEVLEDFARNLLHMVPPSCEKFVAECCHSWDTPAFAEWLTWMATNGYGCDANMEIATHGWDTYGFQNKDEAVAALEELKRAWAGNITLDVDVVNSEADGEDDVYRIEVLCRKSK